MNRFTFWIRGHLAVGLTLSVAAAARTWLDTCDACTMRATHELPVAGAAFYAALLVLALVRDPGSAVAHGIFAAVAVHALLLGQMAVTGTWCVLCIAAAANALVLAALVVAHDPRNLARAAIAVPIVAAASVAILPWWGARIVAPERNALARPVSISVDDSAPDARVRVTIYEKADCPYCEELRRTVASQIAREFESRVQITYLDASELPGIRMTPTVVVSRRDGGGARMIEGLPHYDLLREAVQEAMKP